MLSPTFRPARAHLSLLCGFVLAALAVPAHAQNAPPIKPGLWQVHAEHAVDGQQAAPVGNQMDKLPPEVRKKMEAMMKQRGVDMSAGGGDVRICLSKASLDQNQWMGGQKTGPQACKTEVTSRSSTRWAWHTRRTEPPSETDGEALITSAERYTIKVASTMTIKGETRKTRMSSTSKWLGADCGDLQPVSAQGLSASLPKTGRRP